jgi:hypothetical protein
MRLAHHSIASRLVLAAAVAKLQLSDRRFKTLHIHYHKMVIDVDIEQGLIEQAQKKERRISILCSIFIFILLFGLILGVYFGLEASK